MSFLGLFGKHVPYQVDDVYLNGDKIGIIRGGEPIILIPAENQEHEIILGIFKVLLARIQKLEQVKKRGDEA